MILAEAIYQLLPYAQYRGNVDDGTKEQFDAIEWNDERKKPTWEECVKVIASNIPVVVYDPDKLVIVLDSIGKAEALEEMLAKASARTRLRWQKASLFRSDDPDLQGMVATLQAQWAMTDKERDALLAQCEIDN